MEKYLSVLTNLEKLQLKLRYLYTQSGYKKYSISKFEEYDLYAKNKDFLVSNRVITFTDTDGKLLALKPDVTLSIIKNSKVEKGEFTKVFYDENVYRVSKDSETFKEIRQTGLECFGDIDEKETFNVLSLAIESLLEVSDAPVLNVSDIDLVMGVIDYLKISGDDKKRVLECISARNVHGLKEIFTGKKIKDKDLQLLEKLASVYGNGKDVLKDVLSLGVDKSTKNSAKNLVALIEKLSAKYGDSMVNIDFSVINDTNYYNGIVFNGFIKKVSTAVLTGGRYDKLMYRLKKESGAIGFAIYLDSILKIID